MVAVHRGAPAGDNGAMKPSPGTLPRVLATRILDAVLHRGHSLRAELAASLDVLPDPRDRALVEAICFAALRQQARYDAALALWLPRPLGRRDRELRALLLAGFAQLDPLGLPPHAAVAATVETARALGRSHQAGLVNALLRRAQREGLPQANAADAWPAWLRAQVRADWPDDAEDIFAASAIPAPTWLRVNRRRGGRDTYVERLREAGIEASASAALADAILLPTSIAVAALPGFAEGAVSVQDGAAQAVADALAPSAGARVLDACAAPGGKSAHLLERDPTLRLLAIDVDAARLERVRGTWRRLGLGEGVDADVHARVADAAEPAGWWDGVPFDAILVDAPCSATGIVRRQPDVLLHRRAADLEALVALQARLLDAAWALLRPGGHLVYATCSILRAENDAQVTGFLARTPGAAVEALGAAFGRASGGGRQRLPGDDDMDGFFIARLRRTA
jgi:16S rRNA (cytosine967-C5)-methyltransferase